MERILVLVNGSGPQGATMEFACYIANLTQSALTGIFYYPEPKEENPRGFGGHSKPVETDTIQLAETRKRLEDSKLSFTRFCDNHQLNLKPDTIEVRDLEDIRLHTRFADLLIITADAETTSEDDAVPTDFTTTILRNAECPVLMAPLTFKEISEIVFTYDGSVSSVFAIRQFTHLFPQFVDLPVTLLEVNKDYSDIVNYRESITKYLGTHYQYVNKLVLKGRPEDELFSYFLQKKDVLIVMGAFGRNFLSSIFHRSTATLLLKTTSLPVFISHQ